MNTKEQIEIASIKLAIIQPAFNLTFPDESKAAYYRRISQTPVIMPDGSKITYKPGSMSCWESDYRKGGFDALLPKSRSDAGKSRKLDDDTISAIYRIKEQYPRINATEVYLKLISDGIIKKKDVSLATIQRFIKSHNLKGANNISMKDRKAFEEEYVCGMYQSDTLYGPYLTEDGFKRRTYCIMILDDKSRMIVGGKFFYADNAYNYQKVLKDAIASRGLPHKLYVDNGSPYKNEQLSLICGNLGINLIHTPVRDGAAKGKIERNFRTLRNRFLNIMDPNELSSIDELNSKLNDYINEHNNRYHSAIGMTPTERYISDIEYIKLPESKEWLDECFMNRIIRRVKNDSTITINKELYDVPMEFIRCSVEVRYLPDDMSNAYIWYENTKYPIRKTNKVENGKTKRNNPYSINYGGTEDV